MIQLNGEPKEYNEVSVEEMLGREGFEKARVAVEVNGVIVSKQAYNSTVLHSGDVVEVVSFVGGG